MTKERSKLLSHTRPNAISRTSKPHLSSRTTSRIIRNHHTLQKQLSKAVESEDTIETERLEQAIQANGGLSTYQLASTLGQSKDRGGDTSRILVDWLNLEPRRTRANHTTDESYLLRVLEVGALSTKNAITIPNITKVRRIDLNSREPDIEEVDFIDLHPQADWEGSVGYDIVSLSLVVNYVGDAKKRGAMLKHSSRFLRRSQQDARNEKDKGETLLPALFLVLPLPTVDNSRYLTEERLIEIMASLHYVQTRVKRSAKLYYSLWRLNHDMEVQKTPRTFPKREVRRGKNRNNFCIILDDYG